MSMGTDMYRKAMLAAAGNRAVQRLVTKYGKSLSHRFVAGETAEDALAAVRKLNEKGILATIDHLGEGISSMEEADNYRAEYIALLDLIASSGVQANVSLKPTQMGLALDPEGCRSNIRSVAAHAALLNNFVRLDMEDSSYTELTLDIVRGLHQEGLTDTGTVIQAYLHRSRRDAAKLMSESIPLRLVKGAYRENSGIAYQRAAEVIAEFKQLIRLHLDRRMYTAIASHDDRIIAWTKQYARNRGVPQSAFEFQMLYGLRMSEQEKLAEQGYRVRCYVPYGTMWYPYYTRRLAEKPANLWLVARNMFR